MRATFYTPTDRWRLGARLNWVSVCIFDLHDFQIGCAWGSVCAPGSRFALARGVSVCEPGSRFARLGLGWVGRAGGPNTARGRGTARVSMPNGAHTTPMDGSAATWALHTPTGEVFAGGRHPGAYGRMWAMWARRAAQHRTWAGHGPCQHAKRRPHNPDGRLDCYLGPPHTHGRGRSARLTPLPPPRAWYWVSVLRAPNQSADVDCARESLDQDSRNSWRKGKCATQG